VTTATIAESRFLEVNGLKLHHLDWGNADAPALVCVHGLRGNAHAFDGFARHFRDRYHVIAVDVRGRGDSGWATDGDYSMTTYANDLAGVIDALGIEKLTLVGTSMGGRIGMHYAAHHADRLERFVINDIGPESEAGSERITQEAGKTPDDFATLEDVLAYRRNLQPAMARRSEEEQREVALTHVRQSDSGRWVWKNDPAFLQQRTAGGTQNYPQLWDVLRSLQCPTLLVHGGISDVLSSAQAQRIIDALPNGRIVEVPNVGHAPTLVEPEALAALEEFLG